MPNKDPSKDRKNENETLKYRAKYGIEPRSIYVKIKVVKYNVDYKNISKLDRSELAIAFECEPDEVATNLKQVNSKTKYIYFTNHLERIYLAKTTDNEMIQSQLLNNDKDFFDIATVLLYNLNLTAKVAAELESETMTKIIAADKNKTDKNLEKYKSLITNVSTWSDPKISIQAFLSFIQSYDSVHNKKILKIIDFVTNSSFLKSISQNKQLTSEFTQQLYNKYNEDDKYIYEKNLLLAICPNTSSEILDDIVKQMNLLYLDVEVDIKYNDYLVKFDLTLEQKKNQLKLIIQHENTSSETLEYIWEKIENTDLNDLKIYFWATNNTPSYLLEDHAKEKDNIKLKSLLVGNLDLDISRRIKYLKELLQNPDIDSIDIDVCNILFYKVASDPDTPIVLVWTILRYLLKDPKNKEIVCNILRKNPKLIFDPSNKIIDQSTNEILVDLGPNPMMRITSSDITSILTYSGSDSVTKGELTDLESSKIVKTLELWTSKFLWEDIKILVDKLKLNQDVFDKLTDIISNDDNRKVKFHISFQHQLDLVDRLKSFPPQNFDSIKMNECISSLYKLCEKYSRLSLSNPSEYPPDKVLPFLLSLATSPFCEVLTLRNILQNNKEDVVIMKHFISEGIELLGVNLPEDKLRLLHNALKAHHKIKNFDPKFFIQSHNTPFDILEEIYKSGDSKVKQAIKMEFINSTRLTPEYNPDYQNNTAYKLPLTIIQDILKDPKLGGIYFYNRRKAFMSNPRFEEIRAILGSGDKNYAEIIGIERYFDITLDLLKILKTEEYPKKDTAITTYVAKKDLKIVDLLSFTGSDGLFYNISKIQQYFSNLNTHILERFTNKELLKSRAVLNTFSKLEITLTDHKAEAGEIDADSYILDFCTYLPYDEKEIKINDYQNLLRDWNIEIRYVDIEKNLKRYRFNFSIKINKQNLYDPETRASEIKRCEGMVSDFIQPIKELFSKFQKEIESEKEDYNQMMQKQEYREILKALESESKKAEVFKAALDAKYQSDYHSALNELDQYSLQLQECEKRQQDLINQFIAQLDYDGIDIDFNDETDIKSNDLSSAIVLYKPKLTTQDPNELDDLAKFDAMLSQINQDNFLNGIAVRLKTKCQNVLKDEDYKEFVDSQAQYLTFLASICEKEPEIKKKDFIKALRSNFKNNVVLDRLIKENGNEEDVLLKELQSNIDSIYKYVNLTMESYDKKLPLDYMLIYGKDPVKDENTGLELDRGRLGMIDFCKILKNIYRGFLTKSQNQPQELIQEIKKDLFRLNILLESLKIS